MDGGSTGEWSIVRRIQSWTATKTAMLGTQFNYILNRLFHWPDLSLLRLEIPAKASILR